MKIIALEGLDKSGKHSTSKILTSHLKSKGFRVIQSEFHRYDTPTGRLIQRWLYKTITLEDIELENIKSKNQHSMTTWRLTDRVKYLLKRASEHANKVGYVDDLAIEYIMTADKEAQQDWFSSLANSGVDYLILDRYIGSQVCYSLAKGVSSQEVYDLQDNLKKPDLEIFLDISPEESMRREGKHGENDRYESDKKFLTQVRVEYLEYFKKIASRKVATDISRLDKEEVGEKVNLIVDEYIQKT